MTDVKPGMSKYDVVELLGPPLDTMTEAELGGDSWSVGETSDEVYWLYHDVPAGRETNVVLVDGVVTIAEDKPYDASGRELPDHAWVREPMASRLAKIAGNANLGRFVQLPGWQRLVSAEVRQWIEQVSGEGSSGDQLPRKARRFGELDVIVSYCELTSPAELRSAYFRAGYRRTLADVIDHLGIRPRRYDLAHWVLGRTSDTDTIGLLGYLPAGKVPVLAPKELLSDAERPGLARSPQA